MCSNTAKKLATYDDILSLPDNVRGEIVDGALYTSPRPGPRHQFAMSRVITPLGSQADSSGTRGGWLFLTEPELGLARQIVIPDIGAWSPEKAQQINFDHSTITIIPDWVCEIISPSSARMDRVLKRRIYLEHGIPFFWIIDPVNRTIEALKNNQNQNNASWLEVGVYCDDDRVKISPFDEIELNLSTLWAK